MAQFQSQVPHPLRQDLPALLTVRAVAAPAIKILLTIFIAQGGFEGPAVPAVPAPIEVFCSYAHEDEAWLHKLEAHLSFLQRQGLVSLWHDRLVSPGMNWAQVIDTHLETASIILLLVSADFLASNYCSGAEMKRALERQKAGEAWVIPILIRSADWKDAPFAYLQVFPTDAKPLAIARNKDTTLAAFSAELRRIIYGDDYQVVFWTRADSRESLVSDFVAIATLLKLPAKDAQDQSLAVNSVKRWLEMNSGWLIIFDNADDLKMVSHFLPVQSRGSTLLTTRSQAMGTIAMGIEIEKMEAEEGALFLLHRAKILAFNASLTMTSLDNRVAAMTITQVMDGLPLALDQAGAYIEETTCSLTDYSHLYRTHHAELLKTRGELAFEHPEPVTTTWSLAFEKIQQASPPAADLLRLCAFLASDVIPEEVITEGPPVTQLVC